MSHKMVVLSNAKEGQDEPFNDWYNNVHAVDVLTRQRGYSSVQRYKLAERQLTSHEWDYIAIWEIPDGALQDALDSIRELRAVKSSGNFDPKDTLYRANPAINGHASTWYSSIERIQRSADAEDDHLLTVFSNNRPGTDEEFHAWYAEHTRDVVFKLDGFKSTERLTVAAEQLERPEFAHVVIYRIGAGDLARAQDSIVAQRAERAEALAAGRRPKILTSDTMIEPHFGWWFSPVTKVLRPSAAAASA